MSPEFKHFSNEGLMEREGEVRQQIVRFQIKELLAVVERSQPSFPNREYLLKAIASLLDNVPVADDGIEDRDDEELRRKYRHIPPK